MGELKSAWEIAQEKADRLGKLTTEDEERQRKQRCDEIGQALAQRYLDNPDSLNLIDELNKRPEEEQELVKRAILTYLIQAIDLKGGTEASSEAAKYDSGGELNPRLEKITQGIISLKPESQPTVEKITRLVQEYGKTEEKMKEELENKVREFLHRIRISGTAVGDINIATMSSWQHAQQLLVEALEPELNNLKRELARTD
jgi:hypothetical protein